MNATKITKVIQKRDVNNFMLILLLLFFFCGFSFLVYEIIWLKLLSLIFGVTIYSITIILVCIMAGLALGSYLMGRIADNFKNPLNIFGFITLGLGFSGFITPQLFKSLLSFYKILNAYFKFLELPILSLIFRFTYSFLILILPTTLVGATLPIIVKSSLFKLQNVNKYISLFYSINTLGSVIGCILTGFYFIGYFGVAMSIWIGSILYFLTAIIAFVSGNIFKPQNFLLNVDKHTYDIDKKCSGFLLKSSINNFSSNALYFEYNPFILKLFLFVYFLSGMCAIAYELVWTRVLILLSNASIYSFTIILSIFLVGISIGSYIISFFLNKEKNYVKLFALLEFLIGFTALLPFLLMIFVDKLGFWENIKILVLTHTTQKNRLLTIASLCMMLLPTLFMGMTFPVIVKIFTLCSPRVTNITGNIYSINVLGGILGSIIMGFIFIPAIGTGKSLFVLISVNFLLSLIVLFTQSKLKTLMCIAIILFLLIPLLLFNERFMSQIMIKSMNKILSDKVVIWYKEGLENMVYVTQDKNNQLEMFINRQHQANDSKDMVRLHRLIGHIPMLLHPNPQNILIIGLGAGTTGGAISQHFPKNIDCIELSKSVIDGAKLFHHVNYDFLNYPNLKIKIDDGRNYLLLTNKKYDLIVADTIFPYHSGSGNLYSIEYFNLCQNALKENGLMAQWVPPFIPEYHYKLIIRTFINAFPHFSLWVDGSIIVGSKREIVLDLKKISTVFKNERTKQALEEIGVKSPKDILNFFTLNEEDIRASVGKGKIINDDHPYIEYYLSLPK